MNEKDPRGNAGRGIDVSKRLDSAAATRPLAMTYRDMHHGATVRIHFCGGGDMARPRNGKSAYTRYRRARENLAALVGEHEKLARSRPRTPGKKGAKTRALNNLARQPAYRSRPADQST